MSYFSLFFSSPYLPGHLERVPRRWKCLQSDGGAGLHLQLEGILFSVLDSQQPWPSVCSQLCLGQLTGKHRSGFRRKHQNICWPYIILYAKCTLPLRERMSIYFPWLCIPSHSQLPCWRLWRPSVLSKE